MSSINLLPKDFGSKGNKKKQKKITVVLSVFLALILVVLYATVSIDKIIASKESDSLDSEMKKISDDIKKEVNDNELFLMGDKIKNIRGLLDSHNYFSKMFNVIQNVISEDVHLTKSELLFDEKENLTLRIDGVADSYLTAIDQIAIFKNSYWIDKVEIKNITTNNNADSGEEINFSGNLIFKKDLVLFHEYYWDFGLALLSSKIDRHIEVNEYSAVLVNGKADNKSFVEIEFSGVAYNEEKLIEFKNNLKQENNFIKSISISYGLDEKDNDRVINFKGNMELEL
jgi:Tfp pilus assembly protein PilN